MPIDASTLPDGTPVYSFVSSTGKNTHIATDPLREWIARTSPEVKLVPIEQKFARQMIANNTVSLARVHQLIIRRATDPIVFCDDGTIGANGGPNVMLVDGHHRYVAAALAGAPHFPAHLIPLSDWQQFEIINWIELTQDELIAIPIRERNY